MHHWWSPVTQLAATHAGRITGSTRTPLIVDKTQTFVDAGEPWRVVAADANGIRHAARRAISNGRMSI
jgi:hypothetical protein